MWRSIPMTSLCLCMRADASVMLSSIVLRQRVLASPCCHALDVNDQGDLTGWVDGPLAVDVVRALRLKEQGYRIRTQSIAREITPKNRLLIGEPRWPRGRQGKSRVAVTPGGRS